MHYENQQTRFHICISYNATIITEKIAFGVIMIIVLIILYNV